jgi:predicted ATPase/class 3 adenylate cyclase/DNA-binding SARP family transcriptional activator
MQFDVLGPLRVRDASGNAVNLPSAAQRRLMSLLVLHCGTIVSGDVLEEHLGLSGGALRTAVSRLRRVVGFDTLVTAPPGYELRTESVDAVHFERLLESAADAGETARESLEAAVALWRGEAYAEFADEEWAVTEVQRLATLRTGAIEDLVEMMLDAAEWTTAIATVEPLIEREPFRDRPRGLLMRALAGCGRRTDALRAFQAYRTFLGEEIGTEPSTAIVELDRMIAGGDPALDMPPIVVAPFDAPGVFLMTDIVGSTRLWLANPGAMGADLVVHDDILRDAITKRGGVIIASAGDSFTAVFDEPADAMAAAISAQRALAAVDWHSHARIEVRIALHTGFAQRRGNGWYGAPLNETARIMAAAHGGQILVSEDLAVDLPDVELVDLGEHRLRDLAGMRRLYQANAPELPREFPSLRSLARYVTTLPPQRTALIGRDTLIGEVRGRLIGHALVSLVGPGGVGKTRAAIETAGCELGTYRDGVFFADLTAATTRPEVVAAVVSGVKAVVPPDHAADEALTDHLRDRHALVVLDNCEHVIDDAAAVVDELLNHAPDLHVLATSREALRVRGEQCVVVPSLDVDGPASPGVRLLVERAAAAGAGDILAEDDTAVVELARRLDGIPLALELAAAQLTTLTASEVVEHLDDRFRLLTRGQRPAPDRQRTLEAAIAWSYDLLDEGSQCAFRMLSICAGPFSLETVAGMLAVDGAGARAIVDTLVAKSLLTPIDFDDGSVGYRYLESLREFGRHALTEADETASARHALERALLPSAHVGGSWRVLSNEYLSGGDHSIVMEDVTRREAAAHALDTGRLDVAAFIFSSCAFRDDPGVLSAALERVAPLAACRDELAPLAWRAATATKLLLERLTRRYEETITTAIEMLDLLDADDPTRAWFEVWRCALITAVAPHAGLAEIQRVLPAVRTWAQPPHDWALSQMLITSATGLAVTQRLDDARVSAREGLDWAGVGRESRDQAIAMVLWLAYLAGDTADPFVPELAAGQSQDLGLAELCAAPAALAADGSIEERAALLVAAARRRPTADVTTPFLLAFGWLAVERDDVGHAAELVACAEIYDSSTHVALIYLLARVRGWTDESWRTDCDAAIAQYLGPDHEAAARRGPEVLNLEVDAWEQRLGPRSTKKFVAALEHDRTGDAHL